MYISQSIGCMWKSSSALGTVVFTSFCQYFMRILFVMSLSKGYFFSPLFCSTLTHFRSKSLFRFSSFSLPLYSAPSSPFLRFIVRLVQGSSPSQSTLATFHRSVIGASHGKSPEERNLECDVAVLLFIIVDGTQFELVVPRCAHVQTMQPAL